MTRRTILTRLRDALSALYDDAEQPMHVERTRISTPHWRRASEIVHPECDPSEWVHKMLVTDWDNVVKGKNKH